MLSTYSAKAILTKAKAMYAAHLTAGQYQQLLYCGSVAAIAAYLKEEPAYGQALASVRPEAIYRGQLERMLRKSRHAQYAALMRYDFSPSNSYYRQLMRRWEIEQILEMIQLLNAGQPERFAGQYPGFLERDASFSFAALSGVRDFAGLLQALDSTAYAKILRPFQPEEAGQAIDYTGCEAALFSDYYEQVEKTIDRCFRGRVRAQLHQLIQTRVELVNVRAIYRMKTFFPDADAGEIRRLLMPCWKRIGGSDLEELLQAPSAQDFGAALRQSRYARYLGSDDLLHIDYRADGIEYRLAKRCMHFASDGPTAFTAFLILTQQELDNIVTIIEGVRYGTAPEEISAMLIF